MSDKSNEFSHENSEQVINHLREHMIEESYLHIKSLIEQTQLVFDEQEDEDDQLELLSDLAEQVHEIDNDLLDREITLSAKVRPQYCTEGDELALLAEDIDEAVLRDERGPFVYVTGAEGWSVYELSTVTTEEGEKICLLVQDPQENTYGVLPDEIMSLGDDEQADDAMVRDVRVLYPQVTANLERIAHIDSDEEMITALSGMELTLHKKELHEDIEVVARKLGRFATELANLDTAPYNITFTGDYAVMTSEYEFEEKVVTQEADVVVDVNSIDMAVSRHMDEYTFTPELSVAIGLPHNRDKYAMMQIPVTGVTQFESTRLRNMDLFDDTQVLIAPRPELDDDSHELSGATSTKELLQMVSEHRESLEESYGRMQQLMSALRAVHEARYTNVEEGLRATEVAYDHATAASLLHTVWHYSGDGVVNARTVTQGDFYPTMATATGKFNMVVLQREVMQGDDGEVEYYSPYLVFSRVGEQRQSDPTVTYEIGEGGVIPLEIETTTKQYNSLVRVASSPQEDMMPVSLEAMRRRERAVATAEEEFGSRSIVTTCVRDFEALFNLNLVNDTDMTVRMPLDRLRAACRTSREHIEVFKDLLADTICESTIRMEGVASSQQEGVVAAGGTMTLTGICEGKTPGYEDEQLVFIADVDGATVYIPLSGLEDLRVGAPTIR